MNTLYIYVLLFVISFSLFGAAQELEKNIFLIPCIGRDDPFDQLNPYFTMQRILEPLQELKKACARFGYNLERSDLTKDLQHADYIFCFDVPWNYFERANLPYYRHEQLILFLWEPPSIKPFNYRSNLHREFSKVFTWYDDLVDNRKYYKFYYPFPYLRMIDTIIDFDKKKLCALVAFNKGSNHPDQLYSERKNIIEFFEDLATNEFDLYGRNWEPCRYMCYKGMVEDKLDVLKKYKFCICYENMKNISGYITEKIFDCFHVGCIPIYWGASNISDYIPQDCFIDRRDFESDAALYAFLRCMKESEYKRYLERIRVYLSGDMAFLYSIECFIDNLLSALLPEYDPTLIFTPETQRKLARVRHNYRPQF